VSQDLAVSRVQVVAWVGAEFVGEPAAALVEQSQRLAAAAGLVQYAEEAGHERFADEVVEDEGQELVDDVPGLAGSQLDVEQVLDGRQPFGFQRLAVDGGDLRCRVVAEQGSAPQRERRTDQLDGLLVGGRDRGPVEQFAEAENVD
jgi:hypothetical protein